MDHQPKRTADKGRGKGGKGNPANLPTQNGSSPTSQGSLQPDTGSIHSAAQPGVSTGVPQSPLPVTAEDKKAAFRKHVRESADNAHASNVASAKALEIAFAYARQRVEETFPNAQISVDYELALVTPDNIDNIDAAIEKMEKEGTPPSRIQILPQRMRVVFLK